MATMRKNLCTALDTSVQAAAAGILLNTSPFNGGQNKNAKLVLAAAPAGAAVVKIQGNPTAGPNAPAGGDANWTDIVSLTATSRLSQEITLPLWIRVNVTTTNAGTVTIDIDGVQ